MGVKLVSSGGGSVEINPPATASSFVATMPAGTGNVVVNGVNGALVSGTAVASTSGTSIDFTGIPSWVKRITVMFNGVSLSGTSSILIQLGDSGGFETTGYISTSQTVSDAPQVTALNSTAGFAIRVGSATATPSGAIIISKLSGNEYVSGGVFVRDDANTLLVHSAGKKTLSDTLDRVRITTVNGTDTFDAGSINIMYE